MLIHVNCIVHASDSKHFNDVSTALVSNYDTIVKECLALRTHVHKVLGKSSDYKVTSEEHKLHRGAGWDWNSYLIKGERQADFAIHCPKTTELLESFNLMTDTPFSFAFFSTLKAGTVIEPHHGPCNLRIRCHFPLSVPGSKYDVGMRIGDEAVAWEEKKPLFFDDCYEHEVWNRSSGDRTVLLFDLWHPDLHTDEIAAIKGMFAYAKENIKDSKK